MSKEEEARPMHPVPYHPI